MKFLLTGLLWAAIHGWVLAQGPTVSLPDHADHRDAHISRTGQSDMLAQKTGYQLMTELGMGVFTGSAYNNYLKAEVINGIRIGSAFYGGIGTGIRLITEESSFWGTSVYPVVPVYLDMRLYMSHGNVSPYLAMDAGYSFDVTNGIQGLGLLFNPMAGLVLAQHKKIPVYLEVGYQSQLIKNYKDDLVEKDKTFGGLAVDVGLQF